MLAWLVAAHDVPAWASNAASHDPWSGRYAVTDLGQDADGSAPAQEDITIRQLKDGVEAGGARWLMQGPGLPSDGVRLRAVRSSEYEGLIDTAAALSCLGGGELFVCHAGPGSVAIGDGGGSAVLKTGPDAQTYGEGATYVVKSGLFIVSPGVGVMALKPRKSDQDHQE